MNKTAKYLIGSTVSQLDKSIGEEWHYFIATLLDVSDNESEKIINQDDEKKLLNKITGGKLDRIINLPIVKKYRIVASHNMSISNWEEIKGELINHNIDVASKYKALLNKSYWGE
jgi:hypothetical protein